MVGSPGMGKMSGSPGSPLKTASEIPDATPTESMRSSGKEELGFLSRPVSIGTLLIVCFVSLIIVIAVPRIFNFNPSGGGGETPEPGPTTTATTLPPYYFLPTTTTTPPPIIVCVAEELHPPTMTFEDFMEYPLPRGICNYVFYTLDRGSVNIFQRNLAGDHLFQKFQKYVNRRFDLNLGIDVSQHQAAESIRMLKDYNGRAALNKYWDYGFKSYAVFDMELTPKTVVANFTNVINMLAAIRRVRSQYMPIFIGISILPQGEEELDKKQKDVFYSLIRAVRPAGVLFRTTYRKLGQGSECKLRFTSVFESNEYDPTPLDQPNFLDALLFIDNVTLPPGTRRLLSMSAAGRLYPSGATKAGNCDKTERIAPSEVMCRNGKWHSDAEHVNEYPQQPEEEYLTHGNNIYVFEWWLSYLTKMCYPMTTFYSLQLEASWVLFDFGYDVKNNCSGPMQTRKFGFASIFTMQDHFRLIKRCGEADPR